MWMAKSVGTTWPLGHLEMNPPPTLTTSLFRKYLVSYCYVSPWLTFLIIFLLPKNALSKHSFKALVISLPSLSLSLLGPSGTNYFFIFKIIFKARGLFFMWLTIRGLQISCFCISSDCCFWIRLIFPVQFVLLPSSFCFSKILFFFLCSLFGLGFWFEVEEARTWEAISCWEAIKEVWRIRKLDFLSFWFLGCCKFVIHISAFQHRVVLLLEVIVFSFCAYHYWSILFWGGFGYCLSGLFL